jgi:superfamily I DNA/RNA helicase
MHRPAISPKDIGLTGYICAGHITIGLFHSFPISYIRRTHAHLFDTLALPFDLSFFIKESDLLI